MGRRLGQHFLHDPRILDRIVAAIDPVPHDVVLEIGAGQGTLTRRLAPRVGSVVAIEKDDRLAAALKSAESGAPYSPLPANVSVLAADALRVDWPKTVGVPPGTSWKIVGNVPYQITTPLIQKALILPVPIVIVFLIQKEVADRLTASAGGKDYGALSVGVQASAHVERLFVVRPGAFVPPPAVDSAVVRLTPYPDPLVPSDRAAAFRAFVTGLFGQRRRQMRRGLRTVLDADSDQVVTLLREVGVAQDARPETLSPATFVRLFDRAVR